MPSPFFLPFPRTVGLRPLVWLLEEALRGVLPPSPGSPPRRRLLQRQQPRLHHLMRGPERGPDRRSSGLVDLDLIGGQV